MPDARRALVTDTTSLIALAADSIPQIMDRMREHGIWLSEDVVRFIDEP